MSTGIEAISHDRIEKMFTGDKIVAVAFVVALWATVFFILFTVWPFMPSEDATYLCWTGAGILLLFNTIAIGAMIRHYGADKERIYSIDIHHLDALKRRS